MNFDMRLEWEARVREHSFDPFAPSDDSSDSSESDDDSFDPPLHGPRIGDPSHPLTPLVESLHAALVPPFGKAESVEGELIRVVCKCQYHLYNDGDRTLARMYEHFDHGFVYVPPGPPVPPEDAVADDFPGELRTFFGPWNLNARISPLVMEIMVARAVAWVSKRLARPATTIQRFVRGHLARKDYPRKLHEHYAPGGLGARRAIQHAMDIAATFEPETFEPETFEPETFEPKTLEPKIMSPHDVAAFMDAETAMLEMARALLDLKSSAFDPESKAAASVLHGILHDRDPDRVFNPRTKRWVLRTGTIGQKILRDAMMMR